MAQDAVADVVKQDWEKATAYALTDEDIERAKLLLGADVASREREYIQTATTDNIRNFAHGCGNDNPLHCDPEYGETTRWGSVIAPSRSRCTVRRSFPSTVVTHSSRNPSGPTSARRRVSRPSASSHTSSTR